MTSLENPQLNYKKQLMERNAIDKKNRLNQLPEIKNLQNILTSNQLTAEQNIEKQNILKNYASLKSEIMKIIIKQNVTDANPNKTEQETKMKNALMLLQNKDLSTKPYTPIGITDNEAFLNKLIKKISENYDSFKATSSKDKELYKERFLLKMKILLKSIIDESGSPNLNLASTTMPSMFSMFSRTQNPNVKPRSMFSMPKMFSRTQKAGRKKKCNPSTKKRRNTKRKYKKHV